MSMQQDRLAVPRRMRTLERDARNYPIPFIVLRDRLGTPQFTINDFERVTLCIRKKLCGICGKRFDNGMWFVGGARCFTHEHGAFVDPPMHNECAEYALRICPFLAAPNYAKRIDTRRLKPGALDPGMAIATLQHMPAAQPERFGLGCTDRYDLHEQPGGGRIFVVARWQYVEWWRNGVTVPAPAREPG